LSVEAITGPARRLARAVTVPRLARVLLALVLVATLGERQIGSEPLTRSQPSLVGFSFSPYAVPPGTDPQAGLAELLDRLQPDVVRLPVYWCDVMPAPGAPDFSGPDQLLTTVAAHNQLVPDHPTRVVLVVGVRNIDYPEVWAPAWLDRRQLDNLSAVVQAPDYRDYLQASVTHFAASPLLAAWQVENEPYDNVTSGYSSRDVSIGPAAITSELRQVRRLDPGHPAVVTTYDSATVQLDMQATSQLSWLYQLLPGPKPVGHPASALRAGDALGLDAYVVTPTTPLDEASAAKRISWKAGALSYWAEQAASDNKPLWITEMQAAPWMGSPGFQPDDLIQSAYTYGTVGAAVTLLWGVESWLGSESWMSAGATAINVLRSSPGQPSQSAA
jgi:hypothetical protein